MLIELGNHAAPNGVDDNPKVTSIHFPENDDGANHPNAVYENGRHPVSDDVEEPIGTLVKSGPPTGGYTHNVGGLSVDQFRAHRQEAIDFRNGVTQLPDHEILLSTVAAWPQHSNQPPAWVSVTPHLDLTPPGVAEDVQKFLSEFYQCPAGKPEDVEQRYWTRFGPPGQGEPTNPLPPLTALYTNAGRVMNNVNDGGGQIGWTGVGSAAGTTTFTSAATWTTNQWAGYRIVVFNTAGAGVWGNIVSNTNASSASVATVDRWYNFATPGGAAGTTPANGYYAAILDGGVVSSWFVGMTITNISPAAADNSLSGEYIVGTPASVAAGAGYLRKIAPYAQTSGVASRQITLTPVFTGNANDIYPQTFYAIGVFVSMISTWTANAMKFETSLNASATVAASGDAITVTETITGS